MSLPLGSLISFLLPNAFISDEYFTDIEEGRNAFVLYLLVSTIAMTILSIPALIFTEEEPPSPPSVVANDTNN